MLRSAAAHPDPASAEPDSDNYDSGIRDGLGNVNRWSVSTTSSSSSLLLFTENPVEAGSASDHQSPSTSRRESWISDEQGPIRRFDTPSSSVFSSQQTLASAESTADTGFTTTTDHSTSYLAKMADVHVQPRSQSRRQFARDSNSPDRSRRTRGPSQKQMLSQALQKANTAVLLDNAANIEGAIEAYNDACHLLQLVMLRSNGGEEEKTKLLEIRDTYMLRVRELQRLEPPPKPQAHDKSLPQRPSTDPEEDEFSQEYEDPDTPGADNTASVSRPQLPQRRESLLPAASEDPKIRAAEARLSQLHERTASEVSLRQVPEAEEDYDEPISPRQQQFPPQDSPDTARRSDSPQIRPSSAQEQHTQEVQSPRGINETTSWLNTVDESVSSPGSVQSRESVYLRRRRSHESETEAEFDAALDAAVEAAYDQGLEPAPEIPEESYDHGYHYEDQRYEEHHDESQHYDGKQYGGQYYDGNHYDRQHFDGQHFDGRQYEGQQYGGQHHDGHQYDQHYDQRYDGQRHDDDDVVSNVRRNIEIAKQRVREAEREAQEAMARSFRQRQYQERPPPSRLGTYDNHHDESEDEVGEEEEERMLEEMTKDYVMDDFQFDLHTKSSLPRQSDSSNVSGRTWDSSVASLSAMSATAGTSLSTLAEEADGVSPTDSSPQSKRLPPAPRMSKPSPPQQSSPHKSPPAAPTSVRARRLSKNMAQLRIDTDFAEGAARSRAKTTASPALVSPPPPLPPPNDTKPPLPTQKPMTPASRSLQSRPSEKPSLDSLREDSFGSATSHPHLYDGEELDRARTASPSWTVNKMPSVPANLRKNASSTSLRNLRSRAMSVSTPERAESPSTPQSSTFPAFEYPRNAPPMPTPTTSGFGTNGLASSGTRPMLLNSEFLSPPDPDSPEANANMPLPLEPCPESFLLRPFWLMRCLYQTLAHPKGGYISTRLFIPREIWQMKNVKLRAVEEKISFCDLLTAALLKLAQVDTYDADAVLDEMQSFETVLDQVQTQIVKKLGNEVGMQGFQTLFKTTNPGDDSSAGAADSRAVNPKYLPPWRKLRSKGNQTAASTAPTTPAVRDGSKDNFTLSTLPMTSQLGTGRGNKRTFARLQFSGPNANYMSALARLFDAVQVIDQIARQVEDPGLKHSSPTLVGLELSTRHAAEFFGFYICRFVLHDVGVLLDKFIKRGTEWVLT